MTAATSDWAAIENALRIWVAEALELDETDGERVIWGYPDAPQVQRPFAWIDIVAGPTPQAQHDHRHSVQTMRDVITITGTAAVTVRVHGIDPDDAESFAGREYTAGPGASIAAVRDALVTALSAEPDLAVSASGADGVQVDGTTGRRRFHLVVESGPAARATTREAIVDTVYSPDEITVRVQIEAATHRPSGHARQFASRLIGSLGDRTALRDLRASGLFYRRVAAPQDLTALVGDRHVSRVAVDCIFAINSAHDVQIPWVRTAAATGTATA